MSEIFAPEAAYSLLGILLAYWLGQIRGALRYEQLFHDRSIREIVRDARRDR